ncbi:telomerase reverse transcriptase [Talaromyces islandicus]|uniref:Telomerase reverse transcriptase n=1 Tax=Talaromyces islandicus TaxID=28573 RepID=A0A0U1M7W0_TALIS|nr:telomerase reverse transcriptase [Talaromyces islandicus]
MMGKKRKRPAKSTTADALIPKRRKHDGGSRRSTQSHPVLSRYYPRVVSLREYLLEELPSNSKARRRRIASLGKPRDKDVERAANGDSNESDKDLAALLDQTLIGAFKNAASAAVVEARQRDFAAFTQSEERSLLCTDTGPCSPQAEVVDFAIATIFNRTTGPDRKPRHVLANGFQRVTRKQILDYGIGPMDFNVPGLVPQFPNHHVAALKKAPWTDLLGLLGVNGDDIMIGLLLDCGIFCCVDEGKSAFHQISGVYLSELEPLDEVKVKAGINTDAKISGDTESKGISNSKSAAETLHKPNSIVFVRRRMLYARPALNARGGIRFGLRHIHVLNRFPNADDPIHTTHVMKYMFPRQFGLHNVFTSQVDNRQTVQPFKDYTLREDEIARSEELEKGKHPQQMVKVPKRLRGAPFQLVKKLQKRNHGCSFTELLRHYCPVEEIGPAKFSSLPAASALKTSQQIATQVSLPASTKSGPSQGSRVDGDSSSPVSSAKHVPTQKPCLTDYATPVSSVSAFCRAVLQKLVPREFFGLGNEGMANQQSLMKQIDRFIRLSRFESFTLHEVCKGIKVTSLNWLEPPNRQCANGDRVSLSDIRKRTEILHELVYYIFDSLLIPLIRSNFYVTESQVHRNKLFYFRHDVWRHMIEKPLADMKSSMFDEIKRDKALRILGRKKLPASAVRLLPKSTGTRPIINLRRRLTTRVGNYSFLGPSINSTLTPVFNILDYEKKKNPHLLGSSMFSVGDMYPRLKSFKESLTDAQMQGSFYFVKLDIQSCFDTIPQRRLVSMIENIVSQRVYHVTKHVEIRPGDAQRNNLSSEDKFRNAKPIRKFTSKAIGLSEIHSIQPISAKSTKRNTVQVDTAAAKNHQVDALLDLLDEHVRKNLVKIGKKYFRQKNGIPQGSVLSSLLCNFFYGELERDVLGFLNCERALLLRLIDDFLLVTTDAALAKQFLQVMMSGQPAYGITVNASKSLVNFEATVNGTKVPRLLGSTLFPYCGNLIDTHTLELRKDRDHGRGQANVADSLTTESSRVPGQAFHRKVLASFRLQTHTMFLDTEHNNSKTVLLGIYTNFIETAIKMYRYYKTLRPQSRPSPGLVLHTVQDLAEFATSFIHSKRRRVPSSTETISKRTSNRGVSSLQIRHLCAAAFRHVLLRKQTTFVYVLKGLQLMERSSRPKTDREIILLRRVMKEGNSIFDNWRF